MEFKGRGTISCLFSAKGCCLPYSMIRILKIIPDKLICRMDVPRLRT
jgi:hypothetical protein